jgi:hypothetical protein
LVSFFQVLLARSTEAAQSLLGSLSGILNSDRDKADNWVDVDRRQLCWHISSESSPKSLNAVESPVNWDETCWLNRKSYFASGIESEMGL